MVMIGISMYPPGSAKEVGRRFAQLPPLPQYMTLKGPYFHSEVGLGIKSISLYEFDASKIQEAGEVIRSRIAKIMDVPGYTVAVDIWTEVKDALKMVGIG